MSGCGGIADPPPAARPVRSTGEPSDLDDDLHRWVDGIDIPQVCTEGHELPQDSGEAIVVGAVGSAPWFLTGWAEGVEVDFMIDTGCQVTILAMSVFERMCVSDPRVRSRLRRALDWMVCWERRLCSRVCKSAGFTDGTIVGGGPIDPAVTSTETGSSRGCSPDHFSSVASG